MGCGVSTFYCMDNVGFVKPQSPNHGRSEDPKNVSDDTFSRQTMVSDETGETCSLDSSSSSGCQSKVACVTMHTPTKDIVEAEKARENCVVDKSINKSEGKMSNDNVVEMATEENSINGDNVEEEEPWWRKGNIEYEFMRSPSFRDYCIIHYSSEDDEDEDENEEMRRNGKTSNDKNTRRKENTKAVIDANKKKPRGKAAKSRPKGKRTLHKESSGSLRNIFGVASCYSQPQTSKSPP